MGLMKAFMLRGVNDQRPKELSLARPQSRQDLIKKWE
jgi:hypothetical protein